MTAPVVDTTTAAVTDTIGHLDFQPACEAVKCRHQHPPATHVLRPKNGAWPCGCSRRLLLICTPCADASRPFWRSFRPAFVHCLTCCRDLVIIPALEGEVTPL